MLRHVTTGAQSDTAASPRWRQWFAWVPLAAAGFTTPCCLGLSAALSLSTAVGATFLTEDATLRPILAVTLALTVAGSALTYWRHRRPGPLLVTATAAVWVYSMTYLVGGGHSQSTYVDDMAMADHGSVHAAAGPSGGRLVLIWVGLALLVGAQAWTSSACAAADWRTHREPATTEGLLRWGWAWCHRRPRNGDLLRRTGTAGGRGSCLPRRCRRQPAGHRLGRCPHWRSRRLRCGPSTPPGLLPATGRPRGGAG